MSSYNIDTRESIDTLRGISNSTRKLLKDNNICTLYELINKNKNNLKKIGCTPIQINEIEIQLQLEGLDLNMKR